MTVETVDKLSPRAVAYAESPYYTMSIREFLEDRFGDHEILNTKKTLSQAIKTHFGIIKVADMDDLRKEFEKVDGKLDSDVHFAIKNFITLSAFYRILPEDELPPLLEGETKQDALIAAKQFRVNGGALWGQFIVVDASSSGELPGQPSVLPSHARRPPEIYRTAATETSAHVIQPQQGVEGIGVRPIHAAEYTPAGHEHD